MWKKLGFRESPYDTKPLTVSQNDIELLMGRESEQVDFLTAIESDAQGVFVLSGVPGVGKTSFFNIQQYLLESEKAEFGRRILAARTLSPIHPSDEPKHIALRCIQSYCTSIIEHCGLTGISVPKQTQDILGWVHQRKPATINWGFQILGNGLNGGREIHLPSVNETTYETMVEIIRSLSQEVKRELNFESSFIVLDNIENLYEDELSDCLTTFRDTLFAIPNIWWVLIGQSGLSSLIQSINPKVFQRLSASIELKPISVDDLIRAVDVRVKTFHETTNNGSSPITQDVYLKLFKSSNGEIRFVFHYCQAICIKLVQSIRKIIVEERKTMDEPSFHAVIGRYLIDNHIDNDFSYNCLEKIIEEEFRGLYLLQDEKLVLKRIGEIGKVSPKDFQFFKDLGVGTMQNFTNNYLTKLRDQQLLFRRQEGRRITYELRGLAVFAMEYEILDE